MLSNQSCLLDSSDCEVNDVWAESADLAGLTYEGLLSFSKIRETLRSKLWA